MESAAKSFGLWAQTDPTDSIPHASLGNIYWELGWPDRALQERQTALALDPSVGANYGNLAASLVTLHRFDEARAVAQLAKSHNLDSPELHLVRAWAAWYQGNMSEREELLDSVRRDPIVEQWAQEDDAAIAAQEGRFAKSRSLVRATLDGYRRNGRIEAAPAHEVEAAVREALVGNPNMARRFARDALSRDQSRDIKLP